MFAVIIVILSASVQTGRSAAERGARHEKFYQLFSEVPWQEFPGGRYKASTTADFPASEAISGALFDLQPGGVREVHWHDVNEWAYVIAGECRATAVDAGKAHASDTWTFSAGDVWYFPANVAHAVIGMAPTGCRYLAGYDGDGSFEELTGALGASSWLRGGREEEADAGGGAQLSAQQPPSEREEEGGGRAQLPPEVLAQALGVSVDQVEANLPRALPPSCTLIAQGQLPGVLDPGAAVPLGSPPVQAHRYPLASAGYSVPAVVSPGGWVKLVDVTTFPVSTHMSGALLRLPPGGLRTLHWHLNFAEWQYVINGTVQAGVFAGPGRYEIAELAQGDLGYAPRGSGHYLKNVGDSTDAYVVLIFNAGLFTDVDVGAFGAFPAAVLAASLNSSVGFVQGVDWAARSGIEPGRGVEAQYRGA